MAASDSRGVDRDGGSGCGGVELASRRQAAAVDASTETAAVGVVEWSCLDRRQCSRLGNAV